MEKNRQELVDMLNKALSAEYGALFLLPRHIAQVQDEETKRQLRLIADMELEHAEKTAQLLLQLGEEPKGDLPNLQVRKGLREILEAHLAGEKQAIGIYEKLASLCSDPQMKKTLIDMQREEEGHQRLIERLLERV